MSERHDGGPAFPAYEELERYDDEAGKYRDYVAPVGGMSLRDWFAGKAMQAALTNEALLVRLGKQVGGDLVEGHAGIAAGAYSMADEMLKGRAK